MSVYKNLLENVRNGSNFNVDLINGNLRINNKYYVKNRKLLVDDTTIDNKDIYWSESTAWEVVEKLYDVYKFSVPSKSYKQNSYFNALPVEELTDTELCLNTNRKLAQAMLEGYILLANMKGDLKWEDNNKWFYQGKDKGCVVMKNWIH